LDRFETAVIATTMTNSIASLAIALGSIAVGATLVSLPSRAPRQTPTDYTRVISTATFRHAFEVAEG
jgi:hypothetical protein